MVKVAGSVKYPFCALSPSDPTGSGLGFNTPDEAQRHADLMNSMISKWDRQSDSIWNKDYWKRKPDPWVVVLM